MSDNLALNPNENMLVEQVVCLGLGTPARLFNFHLKLTAETTAETNTSQLIAAVVPLVRKEFGAFIMALPHERTMDPVDFDVFGYDVLDTLNETLSEANSCTFCRFLFGDVTPVVEPKLRHSLN